MNFYILILCLNTITSMINTNTFFDCTDFQESNDITVTIDHPIDGNLLRMVREVLVY